MTGCLFKQALIYHLPLQTLSGLRLKEFPLKSPHDALLFYALRLQPFLGPAALISQTVLFLTRGSRADGCSTLLLRSLGTSALWGPRLMCDDVYCLVICPLSGYQGPEHDRNCGGNIKGVRFREGLWFARKWKESHCFAHFLSEVRVVWNSTQVEGWLKNIGFLVNIFREHEVCLNPCKIMWMWMIDRSFCTSVLLCLKNENSSFYSLSSCHSRPVWQKLFWRMLVTKQFGSLLTSTD